jgi:hypothetical protein
VAPRDFAKHVESLVLGGTAAVLLGLPLAVPAAMPVNPDAAAQATYQCPKVSSDAEKMRVAATLSIQTSDKNALACSADLRFELTMSKPADLETRIAALEALARYIDLVHSLKQFDLAQANWAEYNLRLEHANKLASALLAETLRKWPNEPVPIILTAGIRMSFAGPSDPQITLAGIAELKRAITLAPQALNGEGEVLIGRGYLDLPPLFGGGAHQALPYLEHARTIAPQDPRVLRLLAQAYDELDRRQDALRVLRALAAIPPIADDLQLSADEWRMGEGLAARMGDSTLSNRFAQRRADLMRQHPGILLRKFSATFGHGGDDPMTGRPQYHGEQTNSH